MNDDLLAHSNAPDNDLVHHGTSPNDQHPPLSFHSSQEPSVPRTSIFGGPVPDERLSPPHSPLSSDGRGRQQSRTVSERSIENSSLGRQGKTVSSDVASPVQGDEARKISLGRDLSPLVAGAAVVTTEDLVRRLYKPVKEEDSLSIDQERSRSRDHQSLRRTSDQSNTSPMQRDAEWRRQAVGSPDSIHAIIKTPDQIRSSSGQSFRSSETPPLRRVDRSASGNLRGASKKSEAKRRANVREAEPELDLAIPSSSTYDPLTHKGKHRGDMADIYVSILN